MQVLPWLLQSHWDSFFLLAEALSDSSKPSRRRSSYSEEIQPSSSRPSSRRSSYSQEIQPSSSRPSSRRSSITHEVTTQLSKVKVFSRRSSQTLELTSDSHELAHLVEMELVPEIRQVRRSSLPAVLSQVEKHVLGHLLPGLQLPGEEHAGCLQEVSDEDRSSSSSSSSSSSEPRTPEREIHRSVSLENLKDNSAQPRFQKETEETYAQYGQSDLSVTTFSSLRRAEVEEPLREKIEVSEMTMPISMQAQVPEIEHPSTFTETMKFGIKKPLDTESIPFVLDTKKGVHSVEVKLIPKGQSHILEMQVPVMEPQGSHKVVKHVQTIEMTLPSRVTQAEVQEASSELLELAKLISTPEERVRSEMTVHPLHTLDIGPVERSELEVKVQAPEEEGASKPEIPKYPEKVTELAQSFLQKFYDKKKTKTSSQTNEGGEVELSVSPEVLTITPSSAELGRHQMTIIPRIPTQVADPKPVPQPQMPKEQSLTSPGLSLKHLYR